MLWIFATLAASTFQVARNGLQRGLLSDAGPWGATLVRFLFGLPFSYALAAVAFAVTPGARPQFNPAFWSLACLGATSQVMATASLLVAMRRAGFAVGTALQQSSLPLAAIIGWIVFHDQLSPLAWGGVAVTTLGLAVLTYPKEASGPQPISGAAFGLFSGLTFGFALNAFRRAAQALDPSHPIFAAVLTLPAVQTVQTLALVSVMAVVNRAALAAVLKGWRQSLAAGLCGSLASTGWFIALALAPAAPVRAVGVIEAPIAALAGRRFFKERLHPLQLLAGAGAAMGVVLTALG